ncbi:hypothetical protein ACHAXM_005789 [Skeletonema potamos]
MMSSNGRSPIMMNIKDKSPIKKISNVARRGTKLAASAAHKGSQIYEQVQSRMAEVDKEKSPSRHHHSSTPATTTSSASASDAASAAYRSRVRDQINRFNSVAVSSQNNNDGGSTKEHRHQQVTTTRRHHRHQPDISKRLMDSADDVAPSCNPNYYEKENESNQPTAINTTSTSYSFTSEIGIRVLSPAMHQQRKRSPKKTNSSSPKKDSSPSANPPTKTSSSSQNNEPLPLESNTETFNDTEMLKKHLRALEKDNEKLMKRNSRLERKCDKLTRDNIQLMEQAAGNNSNCSSSSSTAHAAHHADSNSQGHDSYGVYQNEQTSKRDPDEHPLIGSPLRKHMKLVHEAAESNCIVTMKKAPFPLLPPEQTRAILEARKKELEEEEDGQHLDMLGNVIGTSSLEVDANFALLYKKRRGKRTRDGAGGSSSSVEEEEAVDLLTSAAFMFKTSRRNLH